MNVIFYLFYQLSFYLAALLIKKQAKKLNTLYQVIEFIYNPQCKPIATNKTTKIVLFRLKCMQHTRIDKEKAQI